MAKVKESNIYLQFFKSFWLVFILIPLIGGLFGFWYSLSQPKYNNSSAQLELEFNPETALRQTVIADQIVGVLRSKEVQNNLKINPSSQVIVHKNGPLLVNIFVRSFSQEQSSEDVNKLTNFAINKYPAKLLGFDSSEQRDGWIIISLFGFGIGIIIALAYSLIKTYFKNY